MLRKRLRLAGPVPRKIVIQAVPRPVIVAQAALLGQMGLREISRRANQPRLFPKGLGHTHRAVEVEEGWVVADIKMEVMLLTITRVVPHIKEVVVAV